MKQATDITPDDFLQETEKLESATQKTAPAVKAVLFRLLDDVTPINFDNEVNGRLNAELRAIEAKLHPPGPDGSTGKCMLPKDDADALIQRQDKLNKQKKRLTQKHYKIITIEKLLQLIETKVWGLCHRQSFFYAYNGQYWVPIDTEVLKSFLGKVALKMGVPKFEAKDADFRRKLFEQFVSEGHLPEPDIPSGTVLINLQNGTFQIGPDGHQLKDFSRDDFLTYQLPFGYDEQATAPQFRAFLNEVLPDMESQRVLAEYFGWIFIKGLKLEKALVLYGSGGNGKSVIFDVLTALLGPENVTSYPLKSLTDEQGYHRAKLAKTLVNYASEISGNLDTNLFKALISNEPVQARLPYKEPFILTDYGKFIFNANELPIAGEINNAYFRRFLILPFPVEVPPEKQDKGLAQKIIATELPGVLNWILEGLHRLLEQRNFSRCKAADDVVATYKAESDTARLYMDEQRFTPTPETEKKYRFSLAHTYREYRQFCFDDGYKPVSKRKFKKRLQAIGFVVGKTDIGQTIYAEIESEPKSENHSADEPF